MKMICTAKDLFLEVKKTSGSVKISKDLYAHFFEALPPKSVGANFFIFQEGDGEKICFNRIGNDEYYCHLLSDNLVSRDWKIQVAVARSKVSELFTLLCVFNEEVNSDEFDEFVGKKFATIDSISESMGVAFH